MLPLIPYWKFVIHSSVSHQEALKRLSATVAPSQQLAFFSWPYQPEEFAGNVTEEGFRIVRIIRYRNSFVPTIYGRFLPANTGIRIRIVMMLSPFMLIIVAPLGLGALVILTFVAYRLMSGAPFAPSYNTALLLIAFLYLMVTAGFGYEAVIARRLLNRLFEPLIKPTYG